ncbi:hypothetical protein [Streptomyces gibsoniae]|uniref:Uncharacterized protein n=1 Tax=Streptomyces gibsoniae TaxID=3075529 RepID=A0ABU2U6P3_9ACTN|nr:hypothetical protein [Streptomyces sp. DSM 41699]MDT0468745.1 hypothetical protein [Streptomyces sp. DSM 41699]
MPGYSATFNGTGKPEAVFTHEQWADIRAAKGGTPTVQVNVESKTYLDGREVGGFVDQKIEAHDAATGRALNVGRYI